jgi:endonuclease YncB( thermonuclease family)
MLRRFGLLMLLLAMVIAAYLFAQLEKDQGQEIVKPAGEVIKAVDGDSFIIGIRKYRLKGIDAPELYQPCIDESGATWQCGIASRGSLSTLLVQPGLSCVTDVHDQFGRYLANCSTQTVPDIAAVQVRTGYAVSNEFNSMRDYAAEEDDAKGSKRGIWRGSFERPKEWRTNNPKKLAK